MKNAALSTLKPEELKAGDVVLFYDKVVVDNPEIPGDKSVKLESKLFIYKGSCPQGGGDTLLQFTDGRVDRGYAESVLKTLNCILIPKGIAPEVKQDGLSFKFSPQ